MTPNQQSMDPQSQDECEHASRSVPAFKELNENVTLTKPMADVALRLLSQLWRDTYRASLSEDAPDWVRAACSVIFKDVGVEDQWRIYAFEMAVKWLQWREHRGEVLNTLDMWTFEAAMEASFTSVEGMTGRERELKQLQEWRRADPSRELWMEFASQDGAEGEVQMLRQAQFNEFWWVIRTTVVVCSLLAAEGYGQQAVA